MLVEENTDPTSLKAMSLDTGASPAYVPEPSFARAPTRRVPARFKAIVAVVVLGCLGILVAGALRLARERGAEPAAAAPAVLTATEAPVAKPAPPPPPAVVATIPPPELRPTTPKPAPEPTHEAAKAPPPPKTVTLRLAHPGKALTVDGKKAKGSSVVVACGPHMVAVGKEKPHRVEAPCGGSVAVDATKDKKKR